MQKKNHSGALGITACPAYRMRTGTGSTGGKEPADGENRERCCG